MNNILFVFEGQRSEFNVWKGLVPYYWDGLSKSVVLSAYCSNIYSLFNKLKGDDGLDLFSILKADERNSHYLANVNRESISEIYLFFDYDGHDTNAGDNKLKEMLELFNEETDHGRLLVSYPMVEAIRHLRKESVFSDLHVSCTEKNYKHLVSQDSDRNFMDVTKYAKSLWDFVISEHCKKLNSLMVGVFDFPVMRYTQSQIFDAQCMKNIAPRQEVAVLSAFPIFLLDYFGVEKMRDILNV